MHAMEKILQIPMFQQGFVMDRKKEFSKYFAKKPNYDDWKNNCGMALMTFSQLIKHFGWEPMYQFLSEYESDIKNNKEVLPKSNQDKIDQWVIRYSKIIEMNIKPQFKFWGLPVSDTVDSHVSEFEQFCPTDENNAQNFFGNFFTSQAPNVPVSNTVNSPPNNFESFGQTYENNNQFVYGNSINSQAPNVPVSNTINYHSNNFESFGQTYENNDQFVVYGNPDNSQMTNVCSII